MASHQKGSCEKNHVEFRKIVPKGTSMGALTAADMATITSHVNSYPRPSLGGAAPMDLALAILPRSLFEELGIGRVEPGEVVMTPRLLGLDRRGGATGQTARPLDHWAVRHSCPGPVIARAPPTLR